MSAVPNAPSNGMLCLVSQTAELPSTDPNVRPIRSVSFRENAEVLVFAQNDVPMACGPDWDPEQLVYVTQADLLIYLT